MRAVHGFAVNHGAMLVIGEPADDSLSLRFRRIAFAHGKA